MSKITDALGLFRSCIRSGESWSDTCEQVYKEAVDEAEGLRAGLEAADRIANYQYVPWTNAGGVNECGHGYGDHTPCPKCDRVIFRLALGQVENPTPSGKTCRDGVA
jgi:hypothetical protein